MKASTTAEKQAVRGERRSAEERRDEILDIAIVEFGTYGFYGTSTETIATKAGISQPYIFRLFGTKKDLFIAAMEQVYSCIREAFESAVADDPTNTMEAMGRYYMELLSHRYEMLMLLQGFAAAEDGDIQQIVRKQYLEMMDFVRETTHATEEELRRFFADGMLLSVGAALNIVDVICPDPGGTFKYTPR